MSLENQIAALTAAVTSLDGTLSRMIETLSAAGTLPAASATSAKAVVTETPAAAPAEKRTRKKPELVQTPPPEPEPEAVTDLSGLGDDDDGFGEPENDGSQITIEYKKHDAVTALKALRDVAVAAKGAQEGLLIARKALDNTGYGNVANITDADAEKCVDIAVAAAKEHNLVKALRDRALEMGVEL